MSSSTEQNRPTYVEKRACSALQSCLTLCNAVDCSPPGSSVHGILQARGLERVATSSSRGSSRPRGQPASPTPPSLALAGRLFTISTTWEVLNYNTSELIYKTEADPQHRGQTCGCQGGEWRGGPWGFWTSRCKPSYVIDTAGPAVQHTELLNTLW